MQIQAEEVIKLTHEIWSSMLGMEVRPCERVDLAAAQPVLAASVDIIGAWRARVRLDCSARLARRRPFYGNRPGGGQLRGNSRRAGRAYQHDRRQREIAAALRLAAERPRHGSSRHAAPRMRGIAAVWFHLRRRAIVDHHRPGK